MEVAGMPYENVYSNEEILALIAHQKNLNFEPGTEYSYSNSGYFLLGEIVKRVSGKSLRIFAEEQIFSPLGMRNTRFNDNPREIVKNRADGHEPRENGGFQIKMSLLNVVGAGGLLTTIEDLFLWDQNFYCNRLDGYGQELIEEITAPGKLSNDESIEYAFGLALREHRGLKMICHGGWWMGYRSEMMRFPNHRFSVIVHTNLSTIIPYWLALQVADLYLEHEFTEAPKFHSSKLVRSIDISLAELETKAGFYRSVTSGNIREFKIKDGKLVMRQAPLEYQLLPIGVDRFRLLEGNNGDLAYGYMVFEFPSGIDQLLIRTDTDDGVQTAIWEKLSPSASAHLTDYLGTYYSEELESSHQILLEDGKLSIKFKHSPPLLIESVGQDLFFSPESGNRLEFLRGTSDQIVASNWCSSTLGQIHFIKQSIDG